MRRRGAWAGPAARGGAGGLGHWRDGCKVLLGSMVGSKEDVETVGAFFQDLRARGLGSVTALNGEYDAWAGRMKPSNEGRLRLDLAHEALGAGHADTRSGARPRDRTRAARKAPCDRSIGRTAGDLVPQLSDVQDLDGL